MSDIPCKENLAVDAPPDEFRNWLALPQDVTASILMRLEAFDILMSAQMVCSAWHNLCNERKYDRMENLKTNSKIIE
jgi:hypothetical protein